MLLYSEEYEAATPLIASLLWAFPGEQSNHTIRQLKSLNAQIRNKNIQAKKRQNDGLINVEFFTTLGGQLQAAATAGEGLNEEMFLESQATLQDAIEKFEWPEDWNIELDQYTEYCETLARLDDTLSPDNSQASSASDYESEPSDLDELFDGNISNWQHATPLDDIRQEAEKAYGIPFIPGPILGWSGDEGSGYSLIVGNQHQGKKIARVIRTEHSPTDLEEDMRIDTNSRAEQQIYDGTHYDSRMLEGIGLVAWSVNAEHELDPTLSLHPGKVTTYPETYVWVLWHDGVWTWESRWDLQRIMYELTAFQVDLLIYRMAISQDAEYREALTGEKPSYPAVSSSDLQERDDPKGKDLKGKPLQMSRGLKMPDIAKPTSLLLPPDNQSMDKAQSKLSHNLPARNQRDRRGNVTVTQSPCRPVGSSYPAHDDKAELLAVIKNRVKRGTPRRLTWGDAL